MTSPHKTNVIADAHAERALLTQFLHQRVLLTIRVIDQTLLKNSWNPLITATFVSNDVSSSNKNSSRNIIL